MNLWIVLSVLAFFGSSSCVMGATTTSTSRISLVVRIYRTTGTEHHLQQFNISLSEFSSILQKLSDTLKNMNSSQLTTQLSNYVTQLQQVIPKIISNTQDQDSITLLSANLLQLINGLSDSKDSALLGYLKLIESSFEAKEAPVVYSRGHLRRVCRRRRANNSSQTSVALKSSPRTIVVRVNITAKTQVQNLNRTLTTLVRTTSNPSVVNILNQLITTLTSYTKTTDPSKLIQITQLTLQLMRLNPSDTNLSNVSSNLIAFVSSLLGSSHSIARSSPQSQLIGFLTGLTRNNLLSGTQSDKILNTLAKNGVNDGASLLQTLIGILRPLSSKIPARINGTSQAFLEQLYRLPYQQGPESVENLLKTLRNLVNDVMGYSGSDQNAIIDVLRLIITVLLSVHSDNQYATATLQPLLASLRTPAVTLRSRQPYRRCDPRMRGMADLGGIVCSVENVFAGPTGNAGLVGTVQNLLGGVLGGSSGGRLIGGSSYGKMFGGNSGANLLGGIIGNRRYGGYAGYGGYGLGNQNYGVPSGFLG